MRIFALAIFFCLVSPLAHASAPWVPVQADLSAGGNYGRYDSHPVGSLYLGFAAMEEGSTGASFFGAGVEGTVSDYRSPYQWTAGLGSRVGTAWRWRPSGAESRIPDLYLYARVTPIIGGGQQGTDLADGDVEYGRYKIGGGVRVGVGMTAPGWTVLMARTGWNGLSNIGDFGGDEYTTLGCAAACVTYFILTVVNHAELTWETYGTESRAMYGRVGFRIGTGF